jgi:tRNA(fMet)-specific endonuclease VapC
VKYLLDTNICIYLIKKKPAPVFEKFEQHRVGDIGLSAISYSELAYGVAHSSQPEQNELALQEFAAPLEILPYPLEAAAFYGPLRAELKKKGQLLGLLDMLIAAHALQLEAILVTNNTEEFSRISHLRTENWA